jgi:hypothetical protein
MEPLKKEFTLNHMRYVILERTADRYFAELRNTDTGNVSTYETGRIIHQQETNTVLDGIKVKFKAREKIPNNEQFGRCPSGTECCMSLKHKDIVYAEYLKGVEWDEKNTDDDFNDTT